MVKVGKQTWFHRCTLCTYNVIFGLPAWHFRQMALFRADVRSAASHFPAALLPSIIILSIEDSSYCLHGLAEAFMADRVFRIFAGICSNCG